MADSACPAVHIADRNLCFPPRNLRHHEVACDIASRTLMPAAGTGTWSWRGRWRKGRREYFDLRVHVIYINRFTMKHDCTARGCVAFKLLIIAICTRIDPMIDNDVIEWSIKPVWVFSLTGSFRLTLNSVGDTGDFSSITSDAVSSARFSLCFIKLRPMIVIIKNGTMMNGEVMAMLVISRMMCFTFIIPELPVQYAMPFHLRRPRLRLRCSSLFALNGRSVGGERQGRETRGAKPSDHAPSLCRREVG